MPVTVALPVAWTLASCEVLAVQLNFHRGGEGPTILLIHGIGSIWQAWEPVLDPLAAAREVIAIDLPGFGASPMPAPGTPPGIASLTKLVAQFMDREGLKRPHVAGNSLGGWIALELAKEGRARSVTALSPAGFHNRRQRVFQQASLWLSFKLARSVASQADRLLASVLARKVFLTQFVAAPERMPPAAAAAWVRASHAPWFDRTLPAIMRDRFRGGERIAVPVTIAWGERDRLLLPRQAARAANAIPGARILSLSGCGHVPTYDDPAAVAQVLLEGSSR